MKYRHKPSEINAVQFNAPEASISLSTTEQRFIEEKYNVRMVRCQDSFKNIYFTWAYGRISDPARCTINPGDYIVTLPHGVTTIMAGFAFQDEYEPVEDAQEN